MKKGYLGLASALLLGAFLFVIAPVTAYGQAEIGGTIQGTISDATGARVPGATIKVEAASSAFSRCRPALTRS
ncbi:MAG: carboxypeptidase regulatory-like domain-containing protein [Acidobacteria bacterium]|nr:carboxypeptidase regulatory-like domain-containing protein [Acidobacteriota bacterium]